MLTGISPLISPDLLKVLCEMGHGDEIVLADAHFPGKTYRKRFLRADGIPIPLLLRAILPLFALDAGTSLFMMQTDDPSELDPSVEQDRALQRQLDHRRRPATSALASAKRQFLCQACVALCQGRFIPIRVGVEAGLSAVGDVFSAIASRAQTTLSERTARFW